MAYEGWIKAEKSGEALKAQRIALIVAAALMIGLCVRFFGIGSRALWLDEAYSAWFSGRGWAELWLETPLYETHPPTYYSVLKLWRGIAGDSAGALRGFSALAGLAAIPVTAFAARDLGALSAARRPLLLVLGAAALMALSPRLVTIAQDARPYALLLLGYAAGLAFWLRLTRSFRSGGDGTIGNWAGLGVATAAVLWLHGLGILFAAALLGALLLTAAPSAAPARWRRLVVTVALTGLAYLPCLMMMAGRTADWTNGWLGWDPAAFPGAMLDLYGLLYLDEPVTPVAARIVFALLLAVGLRAIWRGGDRPMATALGLLLLFPPLAAAAVSQAGIPIFLPRTLVPVLAPAYLIAAFAIAQLPRERMIAASGAVALLFAANLGQTLARPSLEAWDEAAAILKRNMKPGDVIWAYPNDVKLPLERALGAASAITPIPAPYPSLTAPGYRRSGSPAVVTIDASMARRWAAGQAVPQGRTVWLVTMGAVLSDPDGKVAQQLSSGRTVAASRSWGSLKLQRLDPQPKR